MKRIRFISLAFLSLCLASCQTNIVPYINGNTDVTVSIITDSYCSVVGDDILTAKRNEDVSFKLSFAEGYKFKEAEQGVFDKESSTLIIRSLNAPATIKVSSKPAGEFIVSCINNENQGQCNIYPIKKAYEYGDEVTITTTPKDGFKFLCYSYQKYYRGNKTELDGTAVCFDSTYTFKVDRNMTLYANYFSNIPKYLIDYDLMGGKTVMGSEIIKTDFVPDNRDDALFPVSLNGNYMSKDGYTLIGYNTKPDYSGEYIGIGSKICTDFFEDHYVKLYCQWKKWTNSSLFNYELKGENITITKYRDNGKTDELVFPDNIDGHKVTKIASKTCKKNDLIQTIYLNYSLESIAKNAFENLTNLRDLYLYTSISEIYDESFNSRSLKSVHINKNTVASEWSTIGWLNMNTRGDFLYQYKKDSRKKVILVGHSTILYNHDLTPFKEKWGDQYIFYKYCGTAGINSSFLLYTLTPLLGENDYVFIPFFHDTLALKGVSPRNFGYLQYDLDCIANVNYQATSSIFFPSFLLYRFLVNDSIYSIGVNAEFAGTCYYGDEFGGEISGEDCLDPDNKDGNNDWNISTYVDMKWYSYIHPIIDNYPFDNSHILITWNSYNKNNIVSDESKKSFLDFEEMIRYNFSSCTFFGTMEENILPGDHFLKNDMMHLSPRGGKIRIARWLDELSL